MADSDLLETAVREAAKVDFNQLRALANTLSTDSREFEEFLKNPTEYLEEKMNYVPEGFHAHYAQGENLTPPETFGGLRERMAFTIPIANRGALSACVVCWTNCCPRKTPKVAGTW